MTAGFSRTHVTASKEDNLMIDTTALIDKLRQQPAYDDAHAEVELVRNVGDGLERMRERAGLSQSAMATLLDVTPGRVSQLESGTVRNAPNLKTIAQYARICGQEVGLIFGAEQSETAAAADAAALKAATTLNAAALTSLQQTVEALRAEIRELTAKMAERDEPVVPVYGTPYRRQFYPPGEPYQQPKWRLHQGKIVAVEPLAAEPMDIAAEPMEVAVKPMATADWMAQQGFLIDVRTLHGVESAARNVLEVAGCRIIEVKAAQQGAKDKQIELTFKLEGPELPSGLVLPTTFESKT